MDESLEALKQWLAERYADNEVLLDSIRRADEHQLYELMKLLNLEATLRGMLVERYADNEVLLDSIRRADEHQLYELLRMSVEMGGPWVSAPNQIYDEVQNNPEPITVSHAVQCPTCNRYFWKDRQLKYCTYCNNTPL